MLQIFEKNIKLNNFINTTLEIFVNMFIEFANNLDFSEMYAEVFPLHLRNNEEYCLKNIRQLYEYIIDDFHHLLKPLHEYILYRTLNFMNEGLDIDEQENIFDDEIKQFYKKHQDVSDEDKVIFNNLQDIDFLIGLVFEDIDFLDIGMLFQVYLKNPINFEKIFHVNLDHYTELMPDDIKKEYEKIKINVNSQQGFKNSLVNIKSKQEFIQLIKSLMERFNFYVKHKKLYKLMNNNDKKFLEKEMQILFDFYIDLYLKNIDLDISRESDTGRGLVDFKISCGKKYRALIEFKMDFHSNPDEGLKYQLPLYQFVSEIDYGIFSIVYYDDKLYEENKIFRKKVKEISEEHGVLIEFYPIDARNNKKPGSKVKSKEDMLINEEE